MCFKNDDQKHQNRRKREKKRIRYFVWSACRLPNNDDLQQGIEEYKNKKEQWKRKEKQT